MLVGLPVALLAFAQAAGAAPAADQPAPPATAASAPQKAIPKPAPDGCRNAMTGPDSRTIIVCAQKPEGYRIDPDVIKARREARNHVRPKPPETMKQNDCATVGPMGCRGGGIDIVSAGLVAARMLARAAKGENVGQMFVTDPQPSEYQLYLEAKKEREEKDAQAAAKAARAAAHAPQAASPTPPSPATAPTAIPAK